MSIGSILGAIARGGSATVDASQKRKVLEEQQREKDDERNRLTARQRAVYDFLHGQEQDTDPVASATDVLPTSASPDIYDPKTGAIPAPSFRSGSSDSSNVDDTPPGPTNTSGRKPLVSKLGNFDPGKDYATTYEVARQGRLDQGAADDRAETHAERVARQKETDRVNRERDEAKATTARQAEASNRRAYNDAKRAGAPDAQGEYNADVDYGDIFTRHNASEGQKRSDAAAALAQGAAGRAADAAGRSADAAARAAGNDHDKDEARKAELKARGALFRSELDRLPPRDRQAAENALNALNVERPELSQNERAGIVAEQFEKQMLPGQKIRVGANGIQTPKSAPPGQVEVTDPALQAEIIRLQKERAGTGGE